MKEQSTNKSSSQFLKTDGGKTKSNAIEIPSISLPKGGGAIKGIDEKFSVNAVNGTAGFSIPLPFSPARGVSPSLAISYNSGAGNGIFGLGWNLTLGSIKRKTDKGLPQYLDSIDSDIFLFSEAEDLVPEFKKNEDGIFCLDTNGDYILNERESPDKLFTIRNYKPRIEGLFARIERWTEKSNGKIKWRVITRDNTTTLFGWTDKAVLSDPDDTTKIYEWLPEFVFDDKGNCTYYIYKKENEIGFDDSLLHHRNRLKNGKITYTNLYLDKVLYGNKTPYQQFGDAFPSENDFLFETLFDYGTIEQEDQPDVLHNWDFRPDAFSDYKAGFEIRTTRLCKRVLLFHHFHGEGEYDGLVSSVNFEYDTSSEQDFTFLKAVSSYGYSKQNDGTYTSKKLPPMEFEYQKHEWNTEIKTLSSDALIHAPVGIEQAPYQFVDLYNEGLSGILTEQASGWYYKHNLGDGNFEQAKLVAQKPSFTGLGASLQLADLDADGGKQLVSFEAEPRGYFELDDDNEWHGFRSFKNIPNIDFGDPNTRMLDLNGDGKPEVVISEEQVFTWYASEGREGFAAARKTSKPFDEEEGPYLIFADTKQTIFLADMSGDGMTDIVRIRNGEVCYWPNLGYGKFGAKVGVDHAPVFDYEDAFNPAYIRLADIDGSGTPDIIYLGKNKFTCWKNLSGNRFSTLPFEIGSFPEIHSNAHVTVTDLLGNGVACIVWSSPLAKDAHAPLKYIDLMNSKKPHIMVSYKNNLGKEVSFEYIPSTKFYLEDRLAGKPWATKLHFPVHCLSKTITEDKISGYKFVSEYKYHHGYYDHAEREFRGFGMVEQKDAESFEHWTKQEATNITEEALHQEPVIVKTWHHTGAFLQENKILNQFEKDYWYNEYEREFGSVSHPEVVLPDARLMVPEGMDDSLIGQLTAEEWREALRACKGMALRTETFAKDAVRFENTGEARKKELTPFSVSTHNCVIELLQPRGKNKHAVFIVKESEAIAYTYERDPEDPRIAHNLNIKLDEYGNVKESAAIVYPRLKPCSTLPVETQQEQSKTVILYSENKFTNDVLSDDVHRLRLPSEVKTYELNAVPKLGNYYTPDDFKGILSDEKTDLLKYHELHKLVVNGKPQKRLIEHIRSTYYSDMLTAPLPLHQLESLAIPFESYQLAYTPELVADIFGDKVNAELLTEGKFTHSEGDNNWWIRSGTTRFLNPSENGADARNRFYAPLSYIDPYGAETKVHYYKEYFLFIEKTEDALGNISGIETFNFRTLSPQKMYDLNGNFSEAISDELGMVKAMAIMGKGDEADNLSGFSETTHEAETSITRLFFQSADSTELRTHAKALLKQASTRFVYDLNAFMNTGKPVVVAAIAREQHAAENPDAPVQIGFEFSGGMGEVIMQKAQAEPGKAKRVTINDDHTINIEEVDTSSGADPQLRWIGNGRTIVNNKGNAVKQYEPFFSVSWNFEAHKELVETGVTPIMYYDAAGRLIKTELPNGTFTKVEFDAWKQVSFDPNDTLLDSAWYRKRTDASRSDYINKPYEKEAAEKAIRHANTPGVMHFDTLGRPVLSVEHNRNSETNEDGFYHTKVLLDTEGNLRSVTDARGNMVMQYKYDILGNLVYQNSMDAGQRWLLVNIAGNPLQTWDERAHVFRYYYDILQRPTHSMVSGGDGPTVLNHIFDRVLYGDQLRQANRSNEAELQQKNILGVPIKQYDTGGLVEIPAYDFKGQPVSTTCRLFKKYKEVANWTEENLESDLEEETFTFTSQTDALGRITRQTTPDGSTILPGYNETGLLKSESVLHVGAASAEVYLKNIDYNEKGQRNFIRYGNGVKTQYEYDKETFQLRQLKSKRNNDSLQDLSYTYDPVGNITHIRDDAYDPEFFSNRIVEPVNIYTYDALYRLVEATGRENETALSFGTGDNWNDASFMGSNPLSVRNYNQKYRYDAVGNILEMKHLAAGNNWTRKYGYESANNRLNYTEVGDERYLYPHHAFHGYITKMPHLEQMDWNFKEELIKTIRQRRTDGGTPETTYYQYDGSGQRIRKITENQAAPGVVPTKKDERIYLAGYETYRTYVNNAVNFERETLSLMDEHLRFVMVETVKQNTDVTASHSERIGAKLTRYQLHNHLGSAALELDDMARVISYEEYHPYGTTAYQAKNKDIKASAKRYRYTGMERDEETGLEYHSARYYLPWLGRWLSADPIGIGGGVNLYGYCGNNPVIKIDTNGMFFFLSGCGGSSATRISLNKNPDLSKITKVENVLKGAQWIEFGSDLNPEVSGVQAGECAEYSRLQVKEKNKNHHAEGSKKRVDMYVGRIQRDLSKYDIQKGVDLIIRNLEEGRAVMAGVSYKEDTGAGDNPNKETDHFVTIVGMGRDEEGYYFSYYDNYTGGGGVDVGTDIQLNKFRLTKDSEGFYYFEDNDGTIPYNANDPEHADKKKYILTEVRDTKVATPRFFILR
jgi:RHS repeat-associated protein